VRAVAEENVVEVASSGPARAFLQLQFFNLIKLAPWFVVGMVSAAIARAGLWHWTRPQEQPEKVTLRDEAGGTVTMRDCALNHDPGIRFLEVIKTDAALEGASEFEREMFSYIVGAGFRPAAIEQDDGLSLEAHVRSSYGHVLAKHPAGSLCAALVIAYQTGKVTSFNLDGRHWVLASDKFAQQSMVVVRRMRSFYKLPNAFRAELMRCLGILASNSMPTDLPDEIREVIRAVRIAEMATEVVPSPGVKKGNEGDIDIRTIATLVSPNIVSTFRAFNVNQLLNKSEPLDAIFIKKDGVLLVPPKQMRAAFARILPETVAGTLKLEVPAPAKHPSDQILMQVLSAAGVLVPVYKQVSCSSGVYAARSGQRKFASMWALSTKNIRQEIVDAWGDWSLEVEINGPGEIHVG
jgi:hypothetical protein